MQYMGLNEIREKFLAFFESKDHLRLPSFSLIPQGDKSLLLINSGMAPLKPYFTGEQEPPRRRVTTCQKCIRTGDIENVGKTARHGTFFEMLGNFSFGDYFKKEAIAWSWEFLTEVMGLDPNRLYPSIYEDDDEAFEIWNKQIGIPAERIFRFGKEDNFWEHGSGPCGPCSEIYYDRGEKYGCGKPGCTVGCDCDRYMEVWNNVFSQFNNDGHGNYTELVQKNIDTGMGLERLAVVMQDVDSLFDVDTVRNITDHVSRISGKTYGESYKTDVSLRVITDHIRSTVMMICDGVIPSNEGRGYVLRRLLRRAARHGKLLGIDKPFLYQVCDTVIQESGGAYPALIEKQEYIRKVIQVEEERFDATVDAGLSILNDMIEAAKKEGKTELPAADAFKLHDTYGFPIDLTIEILEEQGMTTDRDGFDALIQEQKERSREDRKRMGDLGWASEDLGLDKSLSTEFCGYDNLEATANVLAIVSEGESTDAVRAGAKLTLVLDRTPFYAEMGGQVPDHGIISHGDCEIEIDNVQKSGDGRMYLHSGVVKSGVVSRGDTVTCKVDKERRQAICRSHTATHLLQQALREVLGSHVEQAGSYTDADHVRFDFTHFAAMTPEEIVKVESIVNNAILEGMEVRTDEMPIDEAKKLGAMALFGEKYGDIVRVVRAGDFSIEFCGGTHLDNTAKAGMFKIVGEASVAAGVRRIEALTGRAFLEMFEKRQETLAEIASELKTTPNDVVVRAGQMVDEMRDLRRNIESLNGKLAEMKLVELFNLSRDVHGVNVLAAKLDDESPEIMRTLGDLIKERAPKMVAVLAVVTGESKVQLLCVCGKEALAAGAHAGKIVKEVAKLCGGGGGGRPDSASAGGKNPAKLEEALEAVNNIVDAMLK
ncbi:alanine--tRNA ligase [Butyricicoccus porcorum]|uniref:Alanine--tRNA ligase n=1 Tax=Butyricicoccus porcorum TaxID=1945634 RepID=A0A252F203_9FIRM|nr:alanine--tRNA ligase [Butyricicoccus porcorum]MCI6926627.1 alanine--tRNA ligase [Butyricicoccus porcorum]MDD6986851.1 alanine--tRNA ligase [Butyricicoccus porcorum]MDY4483169.1 alanine--tRNA ligase [Butyricicoccus porcorum]OUM19749.1 alanine--tRNA ligase [Butyricicoccus porcorum]